MYSIFFTFKSLKLAIFRPTGILQKAVILNNREFWRNYVN